MTRHRLLTGLAAASLLVAPAALLYDFVPAALTRSATALPLDSMLTLKSVMFAIATIVGGATMLYVIYVAIKHSDLFVGEPTPLQPGWKRQAFVIWLVIVGGLMIVAILLTAGTIGTAAEPPETDQELTVEVSGSHPEWSFENEHLGVRRTGQLTVPVDTTVRLEIRAGDVMHNLAIPELGVKQHAIPGQETSAWFVAGETGEYDIVCTELCGEDHSRMTATLVVMEQDEYADYIEDLIGERPYENDVDDGGDA